MKRKSSSKGPVVKRRKVVNPLPIPTLNDDCMVEILKRLPLRNHLQMEKICKHWKNDIVAKSLLTVKSLEIADFYRNWVKWRSTGTCSRLTGSQIFRSIIDRIGNQLELISFAGPFSSPCKFGIAELTLLSRKCPNLKKLVLSPSDKVVVKPAILAGLGTKLSRLESLSIAKCRLTDAAGRNLSLGVELMSQLKEVTIESKWLCGTFLGQLPNSVVSLNVDINSVFGVSNMSDFIGSHPGLKNLQMSWMSESLEETFDQLCRQTIEMLAENCSQLEQLSFSQARSKVVGNFADDRSFAHSFESLTRLKKVKFDRLRYFNDAALKSLCANCPQLEELAISAYKPEGFGPEAFVYVGQLKKLKSLKLNLPFVDDCHIDTLMTEIGATLTYLDISEAKLSDDSLLQIGLKCSRLAHLRMKKCVATTSGGIKQLIEAIVNQESWNDRSKNRRLRIDVFGLTHPGWPTGINLNTYRGRVKINKSGLQHTYM